MRTKPAPAVRYAEVHWGDDLRAIALREMGNAAMWLDLIPLNDLRPPYIAESSGPYVLGYGDLIKIPASQSGVTASTPASELFQRDIALDTRGRLWTKNGEIALVSGEDNLKASLLRHVICDKAELPFHPGYGCYVRRLIGTVNGPAAGQLAAFYVRSALLQDSRVNAVPSCRAEVVGDQIKVTASVEPISGPPVELRVLV